MLRIGQMWNYVQALKFNKDIKKLLNSNLIQKLLYEILTVMWSSKSSRLRFHLCVGIGGSINQFVRAAHDIAGG